MTRRNTKAAINLMSQRRLVLAYAIIAIILIALALRIGWIQVVQSDEYSKRAKDTQTRDEIISPKRGVIYDRNNRELAISSTSYRIWVIPKNVKTGKNDEVKNERYAKVSELLSTSLDIKQKKIEGYLNSDEKRIRIAEDVDKETVEKIRQSIKQNNLKGIEIEENISRHYPLGAFASHLLGSVDYDGNGRSGLELKYNSVLSGTAGRWVKNTDSAGETISYGKEKIYEQEDGLSMVLTIDQTIQHYVEKTIERTRKQWKAKEVSCIVMNPKTGDILAMASTPDFDPNEPRLPLSKSMRKELKGLSDKEKVEYWNNMWKSPLINSSYDPGSTFKLVTISAALEEKVITPQDKFQCKGVYELYGTKLRCWRSQEPHGWQTVTEAVGNSCNPVMIQVTQKTGMKKFYQYVQLFGFTEKTGIDFPGESGSIVQDIETAGPIGLATMSYGQGIAVTPIQMISAVSAIANKGNLMKPRLVKSFVDEKGKVVEEVKPQVVRKVISEKTSQEVMDIMEYVVKDSGGKSAQVAGYRIGGKTGTTQKLVDGSYASGKLMGSMVAVAPMEDPEIAILVIVDEPQGSGVYGSTTAGPAIKEIMTEVLRYLNIQPSYTKEEKAQLQRKEVEVPKLVGKNFSDAIAELSGLNLKYTISPMEEKGEEFEIIDQYPKPGTLVPAGESITLYRQ